MVVFVVCYCFGSGRESRATARITLEESKGALLTVFLVSRKSLILMCVMAVGSLGFSSTFLGRAMSFKTPGRWGCWKMNELRALLGILEGIAADGRGWDLKQMGGWPA